MEFSLFILISAVILAVIHFTAFRPKFISFEKLCELYVYRTDRAIRNYESKGFEFNMGLYRVHRLTMIIIALVLYTLYVIYYIVSGFWFAEYWFWIIVAAQVITTAISIYFSIKRHRPSVNVEDWKPEFVDNNYYKLMFNFLLDIVFYGNLIFFSIYNMINS
jgi:hypothetical protein